MIDRYSRQTIFPRLGEEGQKKLGCSHVVLIGCGGLGTTTATCLVRAGVGKITIIDRDLVEYHNLHRQILYDEDDVKNQLPKAIAAERHLKKVNSSIEVEGVVADVNYSNVERLVAGADLIVDGLDNLETRLVVNDASAKLKTPWVYGAAVASSGMTMNIIPGESPCLRCVFPAVPPPGVIPTCDTAGVISPALLIIGSLQSAEAMKILIGAREINRDLIVIDAWQGTCSHLKAERRQDCPTCQSKYEYLETKLGVRTTILCGQNSVQVIDPGIANISLDKLAERLKSRGKVTLAESTLRFKVDNSEMVIFPDGRVILRNSLDELLTRALYAKYIATEKSRLG